MINFESNHFKLIILIFFDEPNEEKLFQITKNLKFYNPNKHALRHLNIQNPKQSFMCILLGF